MTENITRYQTGPRAGQELATRRRHEAEEARREGLANDLANWAGSDAARVHDEEMSESGRSHGWTCCLSVREDAERNMYHFATGLPTAALERRHESERTDRLLARARRETVRRGA